MELTENVELKRIAYLKTFTIANIKVLCPHLKNDTERHKQLSLLKTFCETNIRTGGITKRVYKYSDDTVRSFGGRLYANGVQTLPKKIRGFLMHATTDIDMDNCHPTILRYLCEQHKIRCPMLTEYVNNRDDILEAMDMSRSEAKELYLKSLNDNNLNSKCKNKAFKAFDAEMKTIQNEFFTMDKYEEIRTSVPSTKRNNWQGSTLNRIICATENQILQNMIHTLNSKGIEISTLMFDGGMVEGDYYNDSELLISLRDGCESTFQGLGMKFSYKPHDTTIVMPDDFSDDICEIDGCYAQVKAEFEKTHFKVIADESFFTQHSDGTIRQSSRSGFKVAYEEIKFNRLTEKGVVRTLFIETWFIDEDKRKYMYADIYPPDQECPLDTFNLWIPFAMEKVSLGEPTTHATDMILKHIFALCGNNQPMTDYFCLWIAQMIQFPSVKTIMPTFISKQGAGKGTLMKLFQRMFGESKVLNEITTPSRDVWGNFNGMMRQAFLVNLDELSGKDSREAVGVLKALVKSETIRINEKGVNSCVVKSFARFIATTNNSDPLSITADDRRNCVIRSSDEHCKNAEYFDSLYKILCDDNAVRNIYEYFKTLPCQRNFNSIPIPQSEYQLQMVELSISPIEQWIREYAQQKSGITRLSSQECFLLFDQWKTDQKLSYEINALKFSVQRSRLGINGVESVKGSHGARLVEFDSDKIKAHCKL